MNAAVHHGGCLCGAVRYQGRGAISAVHLCHCRQCQRWNGGPGFAAGFADNIEITQGEPGWFKSSDFAERGFCRNCGSAIFWRLQDKSVMSVSVGSLDDASQVPPVDTEVFVDFKPDWFTVPDDARRMTEAECITAFENRTTL